jgi:hypothetical protein
MNGRESGYSADRQDGIQVAAPSRNPLSHPRSSAFAELAAHLLQVLDGPVRRAIVEEASAAADLGRALLGLRDQMRAHVWKLGRTTFDFQRALRRLDRRTRQTGFHVLNDWDGLADKVNEDIIPVDVLHYLVERCGSEPARATVLGILVDYYFMHVLALLSVRVWDDGDPDANLDRVGELLAALQGPGGSGQQFAGDAETLLLIATSHYELHERGYHTLLEQTRTLNRAHRVAIALGHAARQCCGLSLALFCAGDADGGIPAPAGTRRARRCAQPGRGRDAERTDG